MNELTNNQIIFLKHLYTGKNLKIMHKLAKDFPVMANDLKDKGFIKINTCTYIDETKAHVANSKFELTDTGLIYIRNIIENE